MQSLSLCATWVLLAACMAAAPALAAPTIVLREVASGLTLPVEMAHAGDGSGRIFIVEQGGRIRVMRDGALSLSPFLDIASLVSSGGERGLLGLAFHPQFAANRAFYVFYTRTGDGALVLARYLVRIDNPDQADTASGIPILTIPHPTFSNHNGGKISFGPDARLYIGTGDGGSGGDPANNAQNLGSLLGKMLRIAVDGGSGYTIPPDNPFSGSSCASGACPEVWAYGLRNPWKFSFDRQTGDLFIGDVGQNAVEEVNLLPAGSPAGANFGWRAFEGTRCFNPPTGCSLPNHIPPIIQYLHDAAGGVSVTGGYRYRGQRFPALAGYYVYGDFGSARVWGARPDPGGSWTPEVLVEPPGMLASISSFGEDEAGNLYVLDYGNGRLHAIETPQGPSLLERINFLGGVQIIANNVESGTVVDAHTVLPGENLLVTDVIISNPDAIPQCCARLFTGPGVTTPRTADIAVPPGRTVSMHFRTGIGFVSGEVVSIGNGSASGTLHFTIRGYRFVISP